MKTMLLAISDEGQGMDLLMWLQNREGVEVIRIKDVIDSNETASNETAKRVYRRKPTSKDKAPNGMRRWNKEDQKLALDAKEEHLPLVAKKLGRTPAAVHSYRWKVETGARPDPRKE